MLGFDITIYPETGYISSPRYWEREQKWSMILASWETSVGGTRWIEALVDEGKAVMLEDSTGYPSRYRCKVSAVSKILREGVPAHEGTPVVGEDYYLPGGWIGKVELHPDRIAQCPEDSFVIIETMDLS